MTFAVELLLAPFVTDSWGDTVKISHSRVRYEVEIELRQISPGLERLVVVKEAASPILTENDLWSAPKQALEQAYGRVVGGRRRSKRKAADFLDAIGERVRLERLREVPAYQCFENELRMALIELGYLS